MKKIFVIVAVAFLSFYMFGCGKKQAAEEEQPMSMEALSALSTMTQAPATAEPTKTAASKSQMMQAQSLSAAPNLEPLPPAGPYKPTGIEVQTALKNANFYTGAIDGQIGPMTKKAIKAFQAANNLQADGKIGPKTWAALGKYLNPQPVTPAKKKR